MMLVVVRRSMLSVRCRVFETRRSVFLRRTLRLVVS
jgi:hypothetical protein